MATHSFPSLHHHSSAVRRRRFSTDPPPSAVSSSLFLTPTTTSTSTATQSLSSTALSLSSSSTTTTSNLQPPPLVSFDLLLHHLAARNFRQADEETRRLLLALVGESAQKRGYVYFTEVQFISDTDLKAIDELWRQHSGGRFGYSVQKKIWDKAKQDFTTFFIKVGWMKKLENGNEDQVVQYNYKAFPGEFMWELEENTPEGHLPLTNCLRGTQLLSSILTLPAFDDVDDAKHEVEKEDDDVNIKIGGDDDGSTINNNNKQGKKVFKPADYSF